MRQPTAKTVWHGLHPLSVRGSRSCGLRAWLVVNFQGIFGAATSDEGQRVMLAKSGSAGLDGVRVLLVR